VFITISLYNMMVIYMAAAVKRAVARAQKGAAAGGQPAAAGLRLQGVAGREDVTLIALGDES
jgi:hypothetical protein